MAVKKRKTAKRGRKAVSKTRKVTKAKGKRGRPKKAAGAKKGGRRRVGRPKKAKAAKKKAKRRGRPAKKGFFG